MRIANLYAGIGGNRQEWGDKHQITAVENNKDIANVYQDRFPKDKVIVMDAHEFLSVYFKDLDCPKMCAETVLKLTQAQSKIESLNSSLTKCLRHYR